VTKGNTPDQPADSLGGTVNLVTKSAFDFKQRVLTYRAGLNLNTYRKGEVTRQQLAPFNLGRYGPTAALTFMDAFGPQRQYGLRCPDPTRRRQTPATASRCPGPMPTI
jgi:outer membrane receptor protein involved in Fe transport